jgi:hypothetical protein
MVIKAFARVIAPLLIVGISAQACSPAGPPPAEGDVGERAAAASEPYATFRLERADGSTRTVNIPDSDVATSVAFKTTPFVAGGVTTTDIKALLSAPKSIIGSGGASVVVTRSGRSLSATPRPGLSRKISWDEAMTRVECVTDGAESLVFFDQGLDANQRAVLLGQIARGWLEGFGAPGEGEEPDVNPWAWGPTIIIIGIVAQVSCCSLSAVACGFQCTHGVDRFECDSNLNIGTDGVQIGLGCDMVCDCHNPYGGGGSPGGEAEVLMPY